MTISQVSKKYNIPVDTLRYYEKEGLIPFVTRTEGGLRDYTEKDCGWVEFVKCMRAAGLSVDTLKKYVTLFKQGKRTLPARKALLIEERDRLQERLHELQATLARLNHKIDIYEDAIVSKEKTLQF